ncbi:hypothetical protein BO99DRAFT_127138 [Aspergillus violaceofuscus CBS 115571]|uniref:Uncharacterized protein n=1 Tax=Aspergillus violaceofuscus (strain CBS 115571) TaxID=1450538 RepID=A0A2V5HPX3_ASPV1|nr:hypothetical protein BO99DRAFT_127138 [Aspergillus violaceofuscus CBS 115571]
MQTILESLTIRPHELVVPSPAEPSRRVDRHKVIHALLAAQVANLLALKLLARTLREVKVLALAVVEPVEEVLLRGRGLPVHVVDAQVAAVAVFQVDHLQEVLEVHHLGGRAGGEVVVDGRPSAIAGAGGGVWLMLCGGCGRHGLVVDGGEEVIVIVAPGSLGDADGAQPVLPRVGGAIEIAGVFGRGGSMDLTPFGFFDGLLSTVGSATRGIGGGNAVAGDFTSIRRVAFCDCCESPSPRSSLRVR